MALSHSVVIVDVPLDQTKPQCLCLLKVKSSNNFSVTYWLVVLLSLRWPVLLRIPRWTVLTASSSSVYSIYILGKIMLVLSVVHELST